MGVTDNLKKYNFSGTTLPQLGNMPIYLKNQLALIAQAVNLLVGYAKSTTPDPTTVANLPAASSLNQGLTACVTDGNSPTLGSSITGGGTTVTLVWSNGSKWLVLGASGAS